MTAEDRRKPWQRSKSKVQMARMAGSSADFTRAWVGIGEYRGEYVEDGCGQKIAHGWGRFEYDNNDCYEGEFHAGCRHGEGTCTFGANGMTYKGEWSCDHMQGAGELVYAEDNSRYSGEFHASAKHGQGTQTYPDGEYSGAFLDNKRQGQGRYKNKDGGVYEGEWNGHKMHGKGTYWHRKNGWKYEGEWYTGKRHGTGVLEYENGDVYDGEFHKNLLQGQGRMQFKGGGYYKGEWEADHRTGEGVLVAENGEKYAGSFASGLRHGYGIQKYANKDVYEGRWQRDTYEGWGALTKVEVDQSHVFEGYFRDGQRHGQGMLHVEGKLVYSGDWTEGQMHGNGELHSSSGWVYTGELVRNKQNGQGKLAMKKARREAPLDVHEWSFQGEFLNNLRHGSAVEVWHCFTVWVEYEDGNLRECSLAYYTHIHTSTGAVKGDSEPADVWLPRGAVRLVVEAWQELRTELVDADAARKIAHTEGGLGIAARSMLRGFLKIL